LKKAGRLGELERLAYNTVEKASHTPEAWIVTARLHELNKEIDQALKFCDKVFLQRQITQKGISDGRWAC
jgi:hypothetical protein